MMQKVVFVQFVLDKGDPYPNAICQSCGDTGEFEDADGNTWECWCIREEGTQ